MKFLRNHWFDLGGFLSVFLVLYLFLNHSMMTDYQLVMWLSALSLLYHQLEEYHVAGTFPGMINKVMYNSDIPDRYPLNSNSALIINVVIGWTCYLLAAIFAEKAVWLGLASILISAGNIIGHTFIFNIKGRTFYNAGLLTCWLFLVPVIYYFFKTVFAGHLAQPSDYIVGIPLGIVLNVVGILKMIDWMKDRNSPYVFSNRFLLRSQRLIR